jgi:MscS family membrane protein
LGKTLINGLNTESDLDDQLAPFLSKTLKVLVVVVGALVLLQNLGINVTALLAGLGIGGMALAFAAQDTVANVFGTITILLDRPFKLGDWIKVGETEGVVEELGFRSTRIRTFYNSLITVPNSAMAKERIDNLSARNGWIRFRHMIGFTYDAKPEVIQQFCENLRYEFMQDPSVDRNKISASFHSYGDSSLNVLIQVHYKLGPEDNDSNKVSQFLELIHQISDKHQLNFAFPTRTLVIENKLPAIT